MCKSFLTATATASIVWAAPAWAQDAEDITTSAGEEAITSLGSGYITPQL